MRRRTERRISLEQFAELSFKRRFLTFLNDNRNYFPDLKFNVSLENASRADLWNGGFEITASRASFQHSELENTTIQNTAMEQIKSGMGEIVFGGEEFRSPVPHTFMYVQWEANKVGAEFLCPCGAVPQVDSQSLTPN